MNDEGFREIQLNGKQLVFLVMAATVVSVVIFLTGVLVGRSSQHGSETVEVAATDIGPDPGAAAGRRRTRPGAPQAARRQQTLQLPSPNPKS